MSELALRDRGRLVELESVIERGIQTFVEVGEALMEIRDSNLYLETHLTFDAYCRERWQMRREVADRYVRSAEVHAVVNPIGLPSPANEAQARELAPLLDQPEVLREAWAEVVEANPKPTASDVRGVVAGRLYRLTAGIPHSGAPESKRKRQIAERRKQSLYAALCHGSKTMLDVFDLDGIQVAAAITSYDELADMAKMAWENARVYRELSKRIEMVMQARRDAGIDDPPTQRSIGDERS